MTDHYREFDHPVLRNLPPLTCDFFSEMDQIADELRAHPKQLRASWGDDGSSADELHAKAEHFEGDDEIAFRQLQRLRKPELSIEQSRDLYAEWRERYDGKQAAKAAAASARLAELWRERDALFEQRASSSSSAERDAATARIAAIARELAELVVRGDMSSLVSSRIE